MRRAWCPKLVPARRGVLGLGLVLLAVVPSARAFAHCAPPDVTRILLRAAAPDEIELAMTFGNALSTDGGKSWKLQCEEAYQRGAVVVFGPDTVLQTPSGRLVLPHFKGLFHSDDQGCSYGTAKGLPLGEDKEPLPVVWGAQDPTDPGHVWLLIDKALYETRDAGDSVTGPLHDFGDEAMLRVFTAADDGQALYVTTFAPGTGGAPSTIFIHVTFDGGKTWRTEDGPFGEDVPRDFVAAPGDAHELLAIREHIAPGDRYTVNESLWRLTFGAEKGIEAERLYDGVPDATENATEHLFAARGPAKGEVWLGVQGDYEAGEPGALLHATDGGDTLTPIAAKQPHFRCLQVEGGRLWSCGNNRRDFGNDDFAVAVSDDGGVSWRPKFKFGQLCESPACIAEDCKVIFDNPMCAPEICATSGGADDAPEAPPESDQDAGAGGGGGGDGNGGCCRTGGPGTPAMPAVLAVAALAMLVVGVRRRRGGVAS